MVGSGSVILWHGNGWSCANEANFDFDVEITPDKQAKRTAVINGINQLFVNGEYTENVEGIFKSDSGILISFKGKLLKQKKVIIDGATGKDFETILNKIKTWQEYYKASY